MPRVREHIPVLAGGVAALAVLLIVLTARDGGDVAVPAAATTVRTESSVEAAGTGPVTSHAPPLTEGAELVGRQLVTPPATRPPAPSFAVETASFADGSTFVRNGAETGPITFVFFMAAWCFTCPPEAMALRQLHEEYGDHGIAVLIVDVDQHEDESDLARFRTRTGNGGHLWALDREFRVARALDVHTLDATVVIDQRGRIAYRDGSPTVYKDLAAVLEALLGEGA